MLLVTTALGERMQVIDSGAHVSTSFESFAVSESSGAGPELFPEVGGEGSLDVGKVDEVRAKELSSEIPRGAVRLKPNVGAWRSPAKVKKCGNDGRSWAADISPPGLWFLQETGDARPNRSNTDTIFRASDHVREPGVKKRERDRDAWILVAQLDG